MVYNEELKKLQTNLFTEAVTMLVDMMEDSPICRDYRYRGGFTHFLLEQKTLQLSYKRGIGKTQALRQLLQSFGHDAVLILPDEDRKRQMCRELQLPLDTDSLASLRYIMDGSVRKCSPYLVDTYGDKTVFLLDECTLTADSVKELVVRLKLDRRDVYNIRLVSLNTL